MHMIACQNKNDQDLRSAIPPNSHNGTLVEQKEKTVTQITHPQTDPSQMMMQCTFKPKGNSPHYRPLFAASYLLVNGLITPAP